jgi:hypothetical protein
MRWIQDPETLELIPADQYRRKEANAPHLWPDLPDYVSPVTGKLISGRRQREEDLKRSGCRPYEGRESEMREAAQQSAYNAARLSGMLERTAAEVLSHMSSEKRKILERL